MATGVITAYHTVIKACYTVYPLTIMSYKASVTFISSTINTVRIKALLALVAIVICSWWALANIIRKYHPRGAIIQPT